MPLEVRELVVKVDVGAAPRPAGPPLDEMKLAALKREIVESCLAELRRQQSGRDER